MQRPTASRRRTSAWLSMGALASAICFTIALVGEQLGIAGAAGEMTDVAGVLEGLPALSPWAWASLGVYGVVLTPVVGIGITAWEYAEVQDRRTVMLAAAVLVVLGLSVIVAILR